MNTVVLAHLSENTNTPELALRTARTALDAGGRRGVRLLVARRHDLTEEIWTRPARPAPRAPEMPRVNRFLNPVPLRAPTLF